jgi:2-isopropylmalate synthase
VIAGLSRAVANDVDLAWEALRGAETPRIHVFISSSDVHMAQQLRKNREDVIAMARAAVARAAKYTPDVEFSPMDATRSDWNYLYEVIEAVIDAGATTINIPDTVGYVMPDEFGELIAGVWGKVRNADKAIISVHCHDDLGMAVANSLAAIKAGARQVEGCINGIGERAGNASIEEVVMALRVRQDFFSGFETQIDATQLCPTSEMLAKFTGQGPQPNKAIIGKNAFAHESGIHQDGVLKDKITYEIMTPQSVGRAESRLVMGKHSGRHALRVELAKIGYAVGTYDLLEAFHRFKNVADHKGELFEDDLHAIMKDVEPAVATP